MANIIPTIEKSVQWTTHTPPTHYTLVFTARFQCEMRQFSFFRARKKSIFLRSTRCFFYSFPPGCPHPSLPIILCLWIIGRLPSLFSTLENPGKSGFVWGIRDYMSRNLLVATWHFGYFPHAKSFSLGLPNLETSGEKSLCYWLTLFYRHRQVPTPWGKVGGKPQSERKKSMIFLGRKKGKCAEFALESRPFGRNQQFWTPLKLLFSPR